ncbi:MAG TPA: VOC family protein [Tepidisphaeraceae bacterium]|nr:VOC family protein [Tepidisphaeraceae bacterium]
MAAAASISHMQLSVEHVAWQVDDPVAVAQWYVRHLGFRVVRRNDNDPARTHFLADAGGRCVVEIYRNPAASVPNYRAMHHLHLHLALAVTDPRATRDALLAAGCTVDDDLRTTPAGDQLCMLRDPFGFAVQLCRRARPLI